MAQDLATLGIRIDASGAITVIDNLGNKFESTGKKAETLSGTVAKLGAAFAGWQAVRWAQETLNLGARYETLGVVMDVVGRTAGKTREQMEAYQATLQKTGISSIGARESLARMAGAQLDMAKASDLARVAQNAAVIANVNSSEAFQTLIDGITTGQPRILRTLGIFIDMQAGQAKYAASLHTTADALTSAEKTQANMNTVMDGGRSIAGAYEAAMGTAGKQLLSTVRYMEDAREKASQAFQPAYTTMVFAYAEALKWAGAHAKLVSAGLAGVTVAVGGLATAILGIKAAAIAANAGLSAGPLGLLMLGAAGVVATYVGINDELDKLAAHLQRNTGNGGTVKFWMVDQDAVNAARARADAAKRESDAVNKLAEDLQMKMTATQRDIDFMRTHSGEMIRSIRLDNEKSQSLEILTQKADKLYKLNRAISAGEGPKVVETRGLEGFGSRNMPGIAGGLDVASAVDAQISEYQRGAKIRAQIDRTSEQYKLLLAVEETKEESKIREQFMKQIQQTLSNGIADMLTRGLESWRNFFDSIKQLFIKMVADMLAAEAMKKLQGSMAGIFGASGSSFSQSSGAGYLGIAASTATIGYALGGTQKNAGAGGALGAAGGAATGALIGSVVPVIGTAIGAVVGGLIGLVGGLFGSAKAAHEAAERQRGLAEQTFLAAKAAVAEAEAKRQAIAAAEVLYASDLRVRQLRASGMTAEADALALWNQQVKEFADAVKQGFSPELLAQLSRTQDMERMAQSARSAADAQRALADAQTAYAQQTKEIAARVAAAQSALLDTIAHFADASDDLSVRMLKATGHLAEADKRAMEVQQKRELRAVDTESRGYTREFQSAVQFIVDSRAASRVQGVLDIEQSIAIHSLQDVLTAQLAAAEAYKKELIGVQSAETAAFATGQSMAGATVAQAGTQGSFNTVVSRATAAQGDRMVDELTTSRVYLADIAESNRSILAKLGGGINRLLGVDLRSAQALSGSSLVT